MRYYKIEAWSEDTGYVKAKNKMSSLSVHDTRMKCKFKLIGVLYDT